MASELQGYNLDEFPEAVLGAWDLQPLLKLAVLKNILDKIQHPHQCA